MSSIRKKATALVPANLKSRLRSAVHPAQRYSLARTVGKRPANLGTLSVVIPLYNVEGYLAACLNSVISQSYPHLDIILVDDGSTDASLSIAQQYARWDKRIKIISLKHGGNGRARNVAIDDARGDFLTFADSDDVVASHAYQIMMEKIAASGSDFVIGSSDRLIGKKKVTTKQAGRLHASERTAITLQHFPEILDDVFLWNKVFRKSFWDTRVAPIPEGVLYEDQETTARAYLRARAFDVLVENVYSWRQRPGTSSITQGKGELRNLQDRVLVAAQVSDLVLREGTAEVAQVWYLRLFGSDLVPYFDLVANREENYWEALSTAVRMIDHKFQESGVIAAQTAERMDPHARVFLGLARLGLREEVEKVIVDRIDAGQGYRVLFQTETFLAMPNYWSKLRPFLPDHNFKYSPQDLSFEVDIRVRNLDNGRGPHLLGYAFIRGLDSVPGDESLSCHFQLSDGTFLELKPHRVTDLSIDVAANDGFAHHASSGFEFDLVSYPRLTTATSVTIKLTIGGFEWKAIKDIQVATTLASISSVAIKSTPTVIGFSVDRAEESFTIVVQWPSSKPSEAVYLSTATMRIEPQKTKPHANGRYSYTFFLPHTEWGRSVWSYPSGAYTLRHVRTASAAVAPISMSDGLVARSPMDFNLDHSLISAWPTQHKNFALTIAPPLTLQERSKYKQNQMQLAFLGHYKEALSHHAVIESFAGTNASDSPVAIGKHLSSHANPYIIYCSIIDYSVPVPTFALPLLRGSQQWYDIVQTAEILVNNNNFPHYFRKRKEQIYVQTWHGTPLKTIGQDAPKRNISPSYRNVLKQESPSWDILIAANEHSRLIFERAFHVGGQIIVDGYPRNDSLINDEHNRSEILAKLGIDENQRIILYAPTWRETEIGNSKENATDHYIKLEALAEKLGHGVTILFRAHHNVTQVLESSWSPNTIDASTYPEVNDLLYVSDVLITDYSSLIFDYQVTGKPAIAYVPDLVDYRDRVRGLYLDVEVTPVVGVFKHLEDITLFLKKFLHDQDAGKVIEDSNYSAKREKLNYSLYDDGRASERYVKRLNRLRLLEEDGTQ